MPDPPPFLRRKSHFMAIYWLVQAVIAYGLALVLAAPLGETNESIMLWSAPLLIMLGMLLLQWIFLLPIRKPAHKTKRVPIFLSIAVAAFYFSILLAALLVAVASTLYTYDLLDFDFDDQQWLFIILAVIAAAWLVSTPLLIFFCRNNRSPNIVQRLAAGLFLGTILEAAAIIPLDLLVRRREECICMTGTFFSLITCGAVGLAVFGPAIFLPLMLPHRKRWYGRLCAVGGYDIRGNTTAGRCPECGAGWRAPKTSSNKNEKTNQPDVDST